MLVVDASGQCQIQWVSATSNQGLMPALGHTEIRFDKASIANEWWPQVHPFAKASAESGSTSVTASRYGCWSGVGCPLISYISIYFLIVYIYICIHVCTTISVLFLVSWLLQLQAYDTCILCFQAAFGTAMTGLFQGYQQLAPTSHACYGEVARPIPQWQLLPPGPLLRMRFADNHVGWSIALCSSHPWHRNLVCSSKVVKENYDELWSPSLFPPQNGRGSNPYKLEILWKWRLGNGVGTYHFIAQGGGYWTGWWCGMMLWYWTSRKNQPFCKEDWLHFVGVQLGHTWTGVNMVAIL